MTSNNLMCSCVVEVTVLLVFSVALAAPIKFVPIKTEDTQGGAVVFFVSYQGHLRELVFDPIVFTQVLVNQGSGYHNDTGVFTAPESGIYQFVFTAQLCRGGYNNLWYFVVNEISKSLCHAQVTGGDTTLNTCYFIDNLKQGDKVWMKQNAGSCAWASAVSKTITFSGVLLARDGKLALGAKFSSCPLPKLDTSMRPLQSSVNQYHPSAMFTTVALLLGLLLSLY